MKTFKYSEIRDTLKTGDMVLMSGEGAISRLIKITTFSEWSHVGIVLVIKELNLVLIFESTSLSNLKDFYTNKKTNGVQVVLFEERLKSYKGKIAIRQLVVERTPQMLKDFHDFRKEMEGRKYEKRKISQLAFSIAPNFLFEFAAKIIPKNIAKIIFKEKFKYMFCSELYAAFLKCWQLISLHIPSYQYNPSEVSKLNLIKGKFKEMYYVKKTTADNKTCGCISSF
jgi:hypothetical protein